MAEPRPTPPPPASLLARVASLLRRTPPTLGQRGERAAARHLKRAGYRVLARNLHLANAEADMRAQASGEGADDVVARYPKAQARNFDGQAGEPTEMDALIAYLQVLGTLVDFSTFKAELESR